MNLKALLIVLCFATTAFAERVVLRYGGQNFQPGDKIFLKQELRRQGYRPADYKIRSIRIVADGDSRGRVSLMINGNQHDRAVIQQSPVNQRGRHIVDLTAQRGPQRGNWQLHFNGGRRASAHVRRVVVKLRERHQRREIHYRKKLQSYAGGFVNEAWKAPRGQRIVRVSVSRYHSSQRKCDRRGGWGFSRHEVWVDNGCRATFDIYTIENR